MRSLAVEWPSGLECTRCLLRGMESISNGSYMFMSFEGLHPWVDSPLQAQTNFPPKPRPTYSRCSWELSSDRYYRPSTAPPVFVDFFFCRHFQTTHWLITVHRLQCDYASEGGFGTEKASQRTDAQAIKFLRVYSRQKRCDGTLYCSLALHRPKGYNCG